MCLQFTQVDRNMMVSIEQHRAVTALAARLQRYSVSAALD